MWYYKEIKYKKITDEEKKELNKNDESCYKIMEAAIDHLNQRFSPLRKTLSPNVAKVQMHMNVFEDRNKNYVMEIPRWDQTTNQPYFFWLSKPKKKFLQNILFST